MTARKVARDMVDSELLPSLLVVDDVPMNLKVEAAMLSTLGFACQTATSGAEALALLRRPPRPVGIIIDIWMPEMDGFELARRIRADADLAAIRLIAVTADVEARDAVNGALFDAFILKPLTLDALRRALTPASPETLRRAES